METSDRRNWPFQVGRGPAGIEFLRFGADLPQSTRRRAPLFHATSKVALTTDMLAD
jgi:hypothetical protein